MIRRILRVLVLLLVALLAYLSVTFVQVWRASGRDEAGRASAIVVLGAAQYNGQPSPVLRARLDHAADLYHRGYADTVVVTGGRQPGDRFTEATASALYLGRKGVPDSAVLREVQGRSSWQSLAAAARFLKARGIIRVLLVSDGFHATRIKAMADELGLSASVSPTRTSPIVGVAKVPYLVRETAAVAVGRVIGFRRVAELNERLHV
ncbi:MAG TPA: YdcF family protein [Acidimicrobiales bacterium]|nr:YdcF family protein [Acidimicrobiales bacterium]